MFEKDSMTPDNNIRTFDEDGTQVPVAKTAYRAKRYEDSRWLVDSSYSHPGDHGGRGLDFFAKIREESL